MSYTIGQDRNDNVRKLYDQWSELLPITLVEATLLKEFRALEDMIATRHRDPEFQTPEFYDQILLQATLCQQIIDRRLNQKAQDV